VRAVDGRGFIRRFAHEVILRLAHACQPETVDTVLKESPTVGVQTSFDVGDRLAGVVFDGHFVDFFTKLHDDNSFLL